MVSELFNSGPSFEKIARLKPDPAPATGVSLTSASIFRFPYTAAVVVPVETISAAAGGDESPLPQVIGDPVGGNVA